MMGPRSLTRPPRPLAPPCALALVLALGVGVAATVAPLGHAHAASWSEVDRLAGEQKLEAAATEVAKLRTEAQRAGNDPEWARALIREVQLRTGLHGYETAVRFLHDQPWPKSPLARAALLLYQASSLMTYSQVYGYEIGQRERVASAAPSDLKTWTLDQIFAAATASYVEIWKGREALGAEKVERFAEYLDPNSYPREVRGTLRDAVSYLFVELLTNTQGWRPEQSNEVFALDVPALVRGRPEASRRARLDDPALHPLVKVGAVLDDLEAWHLGRKERAAALEVRLARARALFNHLSEDPDRDAIMKDLESRVGAARDIAWWSMGQGVLAELEEQRGRLVRAHAAAAAGAKAFPDGPGGQLCRAIVGRLEAPAYQVQAMQADGAHRRSMLVTHKNLAALYLRAYRLDVEQRFAAGGSPGFELTSEQAKKLLGTPVAAEWSTPLPPTTDFKLHATYVTPPLDKPGLYAIVTSGRKDFGAESNVLMSTAFLLTDLVMLRRQKDNGEQELTVLDGNSGGPVAGAEVQLYRFDYTARPRTLESSSKTDDDGTARFNLTPRSNDERYYVAMARHHGSHAIEAQPIQFWRRQAERDTTDALVYTDRSIYRPQQKLLWKAIVYTGRASEARLHTAADRAVTVMLRDPNGQVVEKRDTRTNAFGSVAGELAIPAGRPLGVWSVTTSVGGQAAVRVEEYKRPTFEAKLIDPTNALRLNKPATLTGEVKYYFGLPVTSGQIRWRVTREPVYPFWWGWYWPTPGARAQVIATGRATLDAAGRFTVAFTPKADERASASAPSPERVDGGRAPANAVSFRYRVVADVTSEDGETRTAERAFRLGFVSVEASLNAEARFLRVSQKNQVKATRTDLDGVPRAGQARFRLIALVQPKATVLPADEPLPRLAAGGGGGPSAEGDIETPGDRVRPRWNTDVTREQTMRRWTDGATVAAGTVTHDARGEAAIALPNLAPGAYRLRYETEDDFGAKYETQSEYMVVGDAAGGGTAPLALPAVLAVESDSVGVGGTARILVTSGIPGQTMSFDVWRAGKRILHRRLVSGKDAPLIELPVKNEDRGGFSVSLAAVHDHQLMSSTAEVHVPWDDRALSVSFATFRDKIRPGAKETWKITVKGPATARPEAAAAELLAYMYDRSLDLFAPHVPPSPMNLWPSHLEIPALADSLGEAFGGWVESRGWPTPPRAPDLHGDRLKFDQRYGIGGPGRRGSFGVMRMHALGGAVDRQEEGAAMEMDKAMPPPAPMAAMGKMKKEANLAPSISTAAAAVRKPESESPRAAPAAPPPPPALRSNFSETAFWRPNLLTGADGSATLEFTVPDSVTSWNVWVHAITKDLSSGSLHKETQSIKDLMVRPNMPRFLREGDRAQLKVVVNNASAGDLAGEVRLAVVDPDSGRDLAPDFGLQPADLVHAFKVGKGGGTNVGFTLAAPRQVRMAAFKVTATSGSLSDGELRPLPVLPSRIHLVQSRFVTLRDKDRREMTFKDLTQPDATRVNDQMVVTVEAQLFTTVLAALPYLITYPYECTEQTLNRFLSSAIVGSVFRDFPAVARLGRALSARKTPLEAFDAADPNRKMALEESPWLNAARGEPLDPGGSGVLRKVLDPEIAAAERASSLAKLRKAQLPTGAFPWFPGGPPDPYMTLYIMSGFARAAEFKVDVPKDMVQRGWRYLAAHFREERARRLMAEDCCWEWSTFLNYVASSYPDASWVNAALSADERKEILGFSFKHWKQHSPYLKGLLALTLKRADRVKDARLVWASVMDSARTKPDQGTFWAPEDRSWLWYNDTIESHAFALRTLMELEPENPKKDGLALWLLLNKKLNQWKSTRATAEVIYSLVHYLKADKALGVREDARVTVGGKVTEMVFEPDQLAGRKNQIVIPGPEVSPGTATVTVEKTAKGFAFASATWHFSTEKLPPEERGDFFQVARTYFRRDSGGKEVTLTPLRDGAALRPGDELEVHLSLRAKHATEYVHLRDPRGAGFEPENAVSRYRWDLGLSYYEEIRDSGANFFFAALPAGEYTFKYRVRASMAGSFRVGPATVQSLYAPEFNAYSAGHVLTVAPAP